MAMNEGTIAEWLVEDGTRVERGDQLLTLETEKTAYEVEAPEAGFFKILVAAGETLDCGSVLGRFFDSADELASAGIQTDGQNQQQASAGLPPSVDTYGLADNPEVRAYDSSAQRKRSSPLARKLAQLNDIDLHSVIGTGPKGRVVKRDIEKAVAVRQRPEPSALTAVASTSELLATIPISGMRKTVGEKMMESLQTSAQLSSFWEANLTPLMTARAELVAKQEELGARVSMNALLIKAMLYGIRRVPLANSCVIGDAIEIYNDVHVGFAVSVPGKTQFDSGLIVPVIRNANQYGLIELNEKIKEIAIRAKAGECTQDDFVGSTITFSTTAGLAPPGHRSTPVLNLPNAMLIGPSTPIEKPWNVNGEVKLQTILPISVTFDHRVLDGDPAVRFMSAMNEAIENPALLLSI
jgi:pyruvate/2-oxoglutarate dehydrogenase complex dihydrolipoamide acyltransferase (E2) component